ncbi:MAG: transglycosylase SLT domain-containing protein [Candidatus Competibacteraceae bacterium]|jgi:soluble lytic murein transglycosylase|nr:transglycosylase SLT domain-containing protein [Candidatus Competibacteraceae bacterium]
MSAEYNVFIAIIGASTSLILIQPASERCRSVGRCFLPCLSLTVARIAALLAVLLNTAPLHADALSLSAQRLAFVAADKGLQAGVAVPYTQLSDYPLYPYLRYRDLRQRLEHYPNVEIRDFLRTFADTPLAGRLRSAWLRQLAKDQRWSDFLQDYRGDQDAALVCWYRQALLNTGQPKQALAGIDEVWMRGVSLPNACDPLFSLWQAQGGITSERLWRRFGLAIGNGELRLARYLRSLMPAQDQTTAALWLAVDDDPQLILQSERFVRQHPRTADILLHGLKRWSQQDSVSAAAALDTLKPDYALPQQPLAELERQLALFVASRGHPSALQRLTDLPAALVDEDVQEWRVRVHLQQADWQGVLHWLDQLPVALNAKPLWRYWRARALEASGRNDEAASLYRSLAGERDYHGFLAADRLERPYQLPDVPVTVVAVTQDTLQQLAGIQRARELFFLNRSWEARSEWQLATADLEQEQLRQAAKLAQAWGWHYQAIMTLARTKYWDDLELRFPLPHQNQVIIQAQRAGVDPAWVYAVMRQESLFRADARSAAGALGLMQIMPATGQQIAEQLRLGEFKRVDLLVTDTNIRYGVHYLSRILDRLQNNPVLATAAYNAGSFRVLQWLPEQKPIATDRWVETIPFFETRSYVKRVLEYAVIYAQRLENKSHFTVAQREWVLPAEP